MSSELVTLLFGIASTIGGVLASILAWFAKRHYTDLDRKFEELDADKRQHAEQLRELFLMLARNERIEETVARLEREIASLREDLFTRRPPPPARRPTRGGGSRGG